MTKSEATVIQQTADEIAVVLSRALDKVKHQCMPDQDELYTAMRQARLLEAMAKAELE